MNGTTLHDFLRAKVWNEINHWWITKQNTHTHNEAVWWFCLHSLTNRLTQCYIWACLLQHKGDTSRELLVFWMATGVNTSLLSLFPHHWRPRHCFLPVTSIRLSKMHWINSSVRWKIPPKHDSGVPVITFFTPAIPNVCNKYSTKKLNKEIKISLNTIKALS